MVLTKLVFKISDKFLFSLENQKQQSSKNETACFGIELNKI